MNGHVLTPTIISKIAILTQITIKIMIELHIISEKKSFIKTPKDHIPEEFYNKIVINYKILLKIQIKRIFNVDYKFHRHPLQIIDYKFPIQKKIKNSSSNFEIITK
jgi:hypothetical protein